MIKKPWIAKGKEGISMVGKTVTVSFILHLAYSVSTRTDVMPG